MVAPTGPAGPPQPEGLRHPRWPPQRPRSHLPRHHPGWHAPSQRPEAKSQAGGEQQCRTYAGLGGTDGRGACSGRGNSADRCFDGSCHAEAQRTIQGHKGAPSGEGGLVARVCHQEQRGRVPQAEVDEPGLLPGLEFGYFGRGYCLFSHRTLCQFQNFEILLLILLFKKEDEVRIREQHF